MPSSRNLIAQAIVTTLDSPGGGDYGELAGLAYTSGEGPDGPRHYILIEAVADRRPVALFRLRGNMTLERLPQWPESDVDLPMEQDGDDEEWLRQFLVEPNDWLENAPPGARDRLRAAVEKALSDILAPARYDCGLPPLPVDKVRENHVRRWADRLGYRMKRSRAKRWHLNNRGLYQLIDHHNRVVEGDRWDATLDQIERRLRETEAAMREPHTEQEPAP